MAKAATSTKKEAIRPNRALLFWIPTGLAVTVGLFVSTFENNGGVFVYPLDDIYITLAIAKNLALHGNFAPQMGEWVSASSTPLYVLVNALLYFLLPSEGWPLVLNWFLIPVLFFLFHEVLRLTSFSTTDKFLLFGLFFFLIPLPILAMSGMEHILHMSLIGAALLFLVRLDNHRMASRPAYLYGIACCLFIAVWLRFETLFLANGLLLYFVLGGRWRKGLIVWLAAALSFGLFVLLSYTTTEQWLPSSLMLKGQAPQWSGPGLAQWLLQGLQRTTKVPHAWVPMFLVLAMMAYDAVSRSFTTWREFFHQHSLGLLFLATALQHMLLAQTGWFFRYEAYLLLMGFFAVCYFFSPDRTWPKWRISQRSLLYPGLLVALVVGGGGLYRSYRAFRLFPQASQNVYHQQKQVAAFWQAQQPQEPVALNDIGAVAFYNKARFIDLGGLATPAITAMAREDKLAPAKIHRYLRQQNCQRAILYENYAGRHLPNSWIKVAEWEISENVVCADSVLSFWAANPKGGEQFLKKIADFEEQLPRPVAVRYFPKNLFRDEVDDVLRQNLQH